MIKKLIAIIILCSVFGISGCNDSSQTEENIVPKKEWVDIRGTEVLLQSADGSKLCVYVPNGVFSSNHKDSLTIKFEDFDSFSKSSIKRPIDFKVGVSSIFIRPESSISLINKKARLLSLGDNITLNLDGYEVIESKIGDKKSSVTIINIEKSIGIRFFPGKKIYEKNERNSYLTKLITEISVIIKNCTKE